MQAWHLIVGAAIALMVVGGKKKPKPPPPAPPPTPPDPVPERQCPIAGSRVVVIGDSIAVGMWPHLVNLRDGCPGEPVKMMQAVWEGAHVTQFGPDVMASIFAQRPTHIIVSLGGNDFNRTDPDNVKAAIYELAEALQRDAAHSTWIMPPPMPKEDALVRAWIVDATRHTGYFDTPAVAELEQYRAPDGIHYTPAGYRRLAELVWHEISQWMVARGD